MIISSGCHWHPATDYILWVLGQYCFTTSELSYNCKELMGTKILNQKESNVFFLLWLAVLSLPCLSFPPGCLTHGESQPSVLILGSAEAERGEKRGKRKKRLEITATYLHHLLLPGLLSWCSALWTVILKQVSAIPMDLFWAKVPRNTWHQN